MNDNHKISFPLSDLAYGLLIKLL